MNTGAILNRINFGLAVAGGRIPGVSPQQWPYAAELRAAPRETQVDGVVKTLLGGEVSPETRSVLVSGANPLLTKYSSTATDSTVAPSNVDQGMMNPSQAAVGGGLRGIARPAVVRGQIELNGLSQVIGLALGAPEFQRR